VTIGAPFTPTTISEITAGSDEEIRHIRSSNDSRRSKILEDRRRHHQRRGASDGSHRSAQGREAHVVAELMALPILNGGTATVCLACAAYPNLAGEHSRLSFPDVGGFKRAGVDGSHLRPRSAECIEFGTATEPAHPAFDDDDYRRRVRRAEKSVGPLRLGGTTGGSVESAAAATTSSIGGDVAFDTRLDPVSRNAVYGSASIERLFSRPRHRTRTSKSIGSASMVGATQSLWKSVRHAPSARRSIRSRRTCTSRRVVQPARFRPAPISATQWCVP
jgi:hypothetical protein